MKRLVIASIRPDVGKTSLIIGMGKVSGKKIGYMKPLGDRMLYRKKRLWDHDSSLITTLFDLDEDPRDLSIGFEHAKLRYMLFEENDTKEKLLERLSDIGEAERDVIFVEGGKEVNYGTSVFLDPISLSRYLNADLVFVVSGNEDEIMDDLMFIERYVTLEEVGFSGVIINKVRHPVDFKSTYMEDIQSLGINVLGVVPYSSELTYLTVNYLVEKLFVKVISARDNLDRVIKNIFVGAMSADSALRNPLFQKEKKLIITSGDRSDMIISALESGASCILLTNNILPPVNIISKAENLGIPILSVPVDTYKAAKSIEKLDPIPAWNDKAKLECLTQLVKENVDVEGIL